MPTIPPPLPLLEGDDQPAKQFASERLNLGTLARFPGYVFRRAQAQINEGLAQLLAPYDLRRTSVAVLLLLKYNPGAAPSDIADTLGIARTNFVALVEALGARGLVLRHPRPDDRRFRALYLSREGLKLVNKFEPAIEAYESKIRQQIEENSPGAVAAVFEWLSRTAG